MKECVDYFVAHFGATVEARSLRSEDVYFPLPRELRSAGKSPVAASL